MSDSVNDNQSSESDTAQIIARFGGIRPLAKALHVPVTVVQGWKINDAIPPEQIDAVRRAAINENVDLNGLVADTGAPPPLQHDVLMKKIRAAENRAVRKSTLATLVLLMLVAAAAIYLLKPDFSNQEKQLAQLQQQEAALQSDEAAQKASFPKMIADALLQFKDTMENAQGQTPAGLAVRVSTLENQVAALASPAALQAMLTKLTGFEQTPDGQQLINKAITALNAAGAAGMPQAVQSNDAARQLLGGVAPSDLKPAAVLLGVSQIQDAVQRGSVPFADAATLLKGLLAGQDTQLDQDLAQVQPAAAKGVMTPAQVAAQFTPDFASRIASAAQGGGTMQERAMSGLNAIVQVRKDGDLVSGTDAQAAVDVAQQDVQKGDLAAAAAALKPLSGTAATIAFPWLEEVHDTLLAVDLSHRLAQRAAVMVAGGGLEYTTMGGGVMNMTRDVQDVSPSFTPKAPITMPVQ